jgi:hypothetical protein
MANSNSLRKGRKQNRKTKKVKISKKCPRKGANFSCLTTYSAYVEPFISYKVFDHIPY